MVDHCVLGCCRHLRVTWALINTVVVKTTSPDSWCCQIGGHYCVVVGGISFGRTVWVASRLMVITLCSSDGRLGRGELEKAWCATWAFGSLSQGRDQPFATIIQQLRPTRVLHCWYVWSKHGWRALAKFWIVGVVIVDEYLPCGCLHCTVSGWHVLLSGCTCQYSSY